jgi:hypothetical protein
MPNPISTCSVLASPVVPKRPAAWYFHSKKLLHAFLNIAARSLSASLSTAQIGSGATTFTALLFSGITQT